MDSFTHAVNLRCSGAVRAGALGASTCHDQPKQHSCSAQSVTKTTSALRDHNNNNNNNDDDDDDNDGGDDHSMEELASDHSIDDCESDDDATVVDNQLLDALMAMPERDDATDAIRSPSSCGSSTTDMDICGSASVECKWTGALPLESPQRRKKSPRKWIHAIQNASYQPKPTAFSPHGSCEENPLLEQQRQCRDKLDALASVRKRVQFLPFVVSATAASTAGGKRAGRLEPSMKIYTRMILSKLESGGHRAQSSSGSDTETLVYYESAGIDALAGLECLFFAFLTPRELIRASEVCRSWKDMARHNVIWEPLLFTPYERYPLRELLGASVDLPAIQVFMLFKRLRLTELPKDATKRAAAAGGEPRRHAVPVAHRIRAIEERQRLLMPMRIGGHPNRREPTNAANTAPLLLLRPPPRTQPSTRITSIHAVGFANKGAVVAVVPEPHDDDAELQDEYAEPLVNPHARTDRDDELQFIKDGYSRTTMRAWLQQQQLHRRKLSETTLRSFLRQMLLAIQALELAGTMHSDVSLANIVVLERADRGPLAPAAATEGSAAECEVDAMPLFQLDCSRNIVLPGRPEGLDDRALRHQVPVMATLANQLQRPDVRFGAMRDRRREAQLAAMLPFAAHEDAEVRGDVIHDPADDAMHRHSRPSSMLMALFRCAISAWSRGRFPDSSQHNHMPLLSLLVLLHAHIPTGLRSLLEFGAFLADSGLLTAARLLQHAYVTADSSAPETIAVRSIEARDIRDYHTSVHAWYNSAYAAAQSAGRQRQSSHAQAVRSERTDALMPRTHMAAAYLEHALKERNLSQERFVSIVAPEIKSSSWMRKVAETQRHTLQRLDLSRVMLPTSVLLQELANLPRITHLRLPGNIERPDDLEHFLAALTCTDLLPNLCAMDANVQVAMDRMEQTYREQLNMVEFLLGR